MSIATRFRILIACCTAVLLVGGCAGMLDPGPALRQVLLRPALPQRNQGNPIPIQLAVALPETGNDINTDRIAALFRGYEVRYLGSAKWVSPVPWMFQRLLVDSLESAGVVSGVNADDGNLVPHVRLVCDLKYFYLNYSDSGTAIADVSILVRLLDVRSGKVMGFKKMEARSEAKGSSTRDLIEAFDTAVASVLAQNSEWVREVVANATFSK